jgi:hypothetical protein
MSNPEEGWLEETVAVNRIADSTFIWPFCLKEHVAGDFE